MVSPHTVSGKFRHWFDARGWKPLPFQREAWAAYGDGKSGLIHAPTGLGKTLAAWLGPVLAHGDEDGLRVLWLTPLRALAADTVRGLQEALDGAGLSRKVEARTGDTTSGARARQKAKPPFALVTTPESLSLMLTDAARCDQLAGLRAVVVDEWHELLGSKRGVQTELCLARLRGLNPDLRVWGLSATIGNLDQAKHVLLGQRAEDGVLIHGRDRKDVVVETLMPEDVETFPWSGHLGVKLTSAVVERIERAQTTLLFTNTRAQTEIWFQELLDVRPDWRDVLAMHHGSIDRAERENAEQRLREGSVKCVVCTSSLDLGVDFSPVEQVIQIGSPKGIARLLQRAGRSGHRPGETSRVLGVPTNALELIEFSAAREAMNARKIEARQPVVKPLDLLAQHLITVALGTGFRTQPMLEEVRGTHAFADLSDEEWQWTLTFITTGGALQAYPQYRKVTIDDDGMHRLTDKAMARIHRMSIGTIVGGASISLRLKNGRRLGSVEEWFISGIRPGKCFIFGGRIWELVRVRGLVATVQVPTRKNARGEIPSWQGGKSPLSSELSFAVAEKLLRFREGTKDASPEMKKVSPILQTQAKWSVVPKPSELLIERTRTRDGEHVYLYPFAGRLVNGALGTLLGYRLGRNNPLTLRVTPNDYGVELSGPVMPELSVDEWRELLLPEHLLEDVLASMNAAELGRHHFREVARVAGLILSGTPGAPPTLRALQASSGLLWDVFAKYDPDNLLLAQSQREVLERQLDFSRLATTMSEMKKREIVLRICPRLTPLAFPLWADRISHHVGKEDPATVLANMLAELESAAAR
ncbi:MAG: ligase-associated DNA damage response DEXH box helicase [Verrucomicrobiales bacterium]